MKNFTLIVLLSMIFSSCLKDGNETIILPEVKYAKPISEVVPVAIQEKLKVYMPIYSGSTPPDLEGTYLISPDKIVYSTIISDDLSKIYSDVTIRFLSQNLVTNVIIYSEKANNSSATSDYVSVVGSSDQFTAYFITEGISRSISTKTATVISGTKSSSGIKNLYYAFVMLEKGADPTNVLVDVGTYRIFKDNDGLAANTTWVKSAKVFSEEKTSLQR